MKHFLPEEELIEYVKPYLKAKGFKKKNKTWTKDIGDFTLYFYVQGSCFSKETYYIRPSIRINALPSDMLVHGHYMTQIEQTTPEEIMKKFEQWCEEWTNKSLIKERLIAFIEWENAIRLKNAEQNLLIMKKTLFPPKSFS